MGDVYITGMGRFLPGEPVSNDEMESYLGLVGGKPSRARERVLKQNGIRHRYYAIDREQQSRFRNSEMAANAVRDAVQHAGLRLDDVEFLAAATTQPDLLVPGFASMVHGEIGTRPMELASHQGVCASGVMALKSAYLQVKAGDRSTAVAVASEFPSRVFKGGRYTNQARIEDGGTLPFDTEFLRWMLSDGAGAAVLSPKPNAHGLSLKIEWIEQASYAHENGVCMYAGANKDGGDVGTAWLDYPSFEAAASDGAINLKQDMRLLDRIFQLGVRGFFELIEKGKLDPAKIDWLACHYSSHVFKAKVVELLAAGGLVIPDERWFSNIYEKGNVGSATVFMLLEELLNDGKVKPGQQIAVVIPESGRFIMAYALLTVVEGTGVAPKKFAPMVIETGAPKLNVGADPLQQKLVRQLVNVWVDFEQELRKVPVLARLEDGSFTLEDYKALLVNIRQQVVEGSRWISRAASSITVEAAELRSSFIQHARDEHRDYEMLERDYVSVGGDREVIRNTPKNLGSEALSAWMFQRASRENPFDLLGAMFIIEGLGNRLAGRWAARIRELLDLDEKQVSFLGYHGLNDETHFAKLESAIGSGLLTPEILDRVVKTAKVTARLYRLQLEELGHF